MLLKDLFYTTNIVPEEEGCELVESARMAWARSGNKIVRKYRCTSGQRKGRIVSNPAQCSKAIDIKKRMQLRKTKAKMGGRMTRKAKKTKRISPVSRRLKKMNIRR